MVDAGRETFCGGTVDDEDIGFDDVGVGGGFVVADGDGGSG